MSFLTIPNQGGLFTAIKANRETEEGRGDSPVDEDEDDEEQNVRLIPRSSPIPRKRGQSIYDEDDEYRRIQLTLPPRRVSFADKTGGDLVHVKEFVAFDSDEEDNARWEEEEMKYRRPHREPHYLVRPEFDMPTTAGLTHAVHIHKVEVELVSPVEDEPLAFSGIIRVLNISFKKAVYIRSTMDSWGTYFDYPAEYMQGSNDGETDRFSFKLSFAPPYVTHGSRIEFVVRFETPEGDYWANNSGRNYVVTLLVFCEELGQVSGYGMQEIKSILKPAKIYSLKDEDEEYSDQDEGGVESALTVPEVVSPSPICPVIVQPEIDVKRADDTPSFPRFPPSPDPPSADGTLFGATVTPGEQSPDVSSTAPTTDDPSVASQDNRSLRPFEPVLLPKQDRELEDQTREEPQDSSPSTLLPVPTAPPTPLTSSARASECEEEEGGALTPNSPEPDALTDRPHPDTELLHTVRDDAPLADLIDVVPDLTLQDSGDPLSDRPRIIIVAPYVDSTLTDTEPNLFVADSTCVAVSIHLVTAVPNTGTYLPRTDLALFDTDQEDTQSGDTTHTDPSHTITALPRTEIQADVPSLNCTANKYDLPATSGELMEEAESEVKEEEDLRPEEEEKGKEEREESIGTQEPVSSSISLSEQLSDPDNCKCGTEGNMKTGVPPTESPSSPVESENLTRLNNAGLTVEAGPQSESLEAAEEEVPEVECIWHSPVVETHPGPTREDRVTPTLPSLSDTNSARQVNPAAVLVDDPGLSSLQEEGTCTVGGLTPVGAGRTAAAPGFTRISVSEGSSEIQPSTPQDCALIPHKVGEEEESFRVASVTPANLPSGLAEDPKPPSPKSETTVDRSLRRASVTFLCLAICLAVGLQQPGLLPYTGLVLISFCF